MADKDEVSDRMRMRGVTVLSDNYYILRKAAFDFRRRDGTWQAQTRESYDRGHGAAVLPYDPARGMVLLVKQFRYPAFEVGYRRMLIEAIAGLLDGDDGETCARKEAMEEAGVKLGAVRRVFHCFMSPGAVNERLHLFVGEYDAASRVGKGGGQASEGEDIEVLEMGLDDALFKVANGEIVDAKTIMLLQWVRISEL